MRISSLLQRATEPIAEQPAPDPERRSGIDLYWLPLGAGGHSVRLSGRIFEAAAARLGGRVPYDLYHSALEVRTPDGRYVIEMAPVPAGGAEDRGVVAEGSVGAQWAGWLRIFRYEVRRWRDGRIPDIDEAVNSPQQLTGAPDAGRALLDLVAQVPTPVWGRDELRTGEMWNSNSLISWLIERGGLDLGAVHLPARGRAPGWDAGRLVAHRQATASLPRGLRGTGE